MRRRFGGKEGTRGCRGAVPVAVLAAALAALGPGPAALRPPASPAQAATPVAPLVASPAAPPSAELEAVVERFRTYGEACDADGRAGLFALPFVSFFRRAGDPGYQARVFEDRDDLADHFRCDAGLEGVAAVYDQVVVHPQGDRATASFRHQTKLEYLNHCAQTRGRTTWALERQASGGWLIVAATTESSGPVPVAC